MKTKLILFMSSLIGLIFTLLAFHIMHSHSHSGDLLEKVKLSNSDKPETELKLSPREEPNSMLDKQKDKTKNESSSSVVFV